MEQQPNQLEQPNQFETLFDKTSNYLETSLELIRLKSIRKSSDIVSVLVSKLILYFIISIFLKEPIIHFPFCFCSNRHFTEAAFLQKVSFFSTFVSHCYLCYLLLSLKLFFYFWRMSPIKRLIR